MSTIRFTDEGHWNAIEEHLASARWERFAFALTQVAAEDADGPVLKVEDVELIHDEDVERERTGWTIADAALDRVHNRAIIEQRCLVEFHNHRTGLPGFSRTDEAALKPMAEYVLEALGRNVYGAAVWANGTVHAEWFRHDGDVLVRGAFRTVAVVGHHLRLVNVQHADEERFRRQIPILGRSGQATLRHLRVAIIGGGGTGSHAVTLLTYLGVRDFLLLDDDMIDATSLNRVVTADRTDIDVAKTAVARRRVEALDPNATVRTLPGLTPDGHHPELVEADLIIGCVDNDGPRHRLNELAVATGVPYVDIGTGVDPHVEPPATGGRVAFVLSGGPCLTCTEELDPAEVARWYKSSDQQELDRQHGYGTTEPHPSVVHLNGLAVNAAIAEIVAWITGARAPAFRLDIDVDGDPELPGTRISPSADTARRPGCVDCAWTYRPVDSTTAA